MRLLRLRGLRRFGRFLREEFQHREGGEQRVPLLLGELSDPVGEAGQLGSTRRR
ncbi:hypothetical protein OG871_09445 [Kitasatospora sp. NBC_00374]|uniref:hypothetical protein n=1 Tax=Kitasatospora sp. NBC_00374 TaxID=2975964 RepID=UPI0030E09D0C